MYAHIKGIVDSVTADKAVIDASGIGYELNCSSQTLNKLIEGKQAKLYTHLNISQDAVALYGFYSESERTMFRKLLGVSRIGPKVALSVLSVLTPEDVSLAVITDNVAAFDRVQGMGRKTAARVILELKEKVEAAAPSDSGGTPSAASMKSEAIAALVSLGYDGAEAGRVVSELPELSTVEETIKSALREFSKR